MQKKLKLVLRANQVKQSSDVIHVLGGQNMQIVTWMGQMLESGKVTLSTKNKEDLEVIAVNKRIDVNLKDKKFIKDNPQRTQR